MRNAPKLQESAPGKTDPMDKRYYDTVYGLVEEVIFCRGILLAGMVRQAEAIGAVLPPNPVTFPGQKQYIPDLFRDLKDPYISIEMQLYDGMEAKICELINTAELWMEDIETDDFAHPYGAPCSLQGAIDFEVEEHTSEIYHSMQQTVLFRGCLFQGILGLLEMTEYASLKVPADRGFYTSEYRSVPDPVFQLFLDVCDLQDRMIFKVFLRDMQYLEFMDWEHWGFANEDLR